ncbi:MAG TPA: ABC transporter substrate-binding protein [Alphaproteobacteria bacterium]|nr:ABC transporter substrate-binding protein [Alphaproteobacteria bacterium]
MKMLGLLSRRDFALLSANMAVASFAGGALLGMRPAFAADDKAVLGHFGSANPQTFAKATSSFQKAFGDKTKVDFMTVNSGAQVVAAMAGDSLDICNVGSSPMVVGFCNGLKISMVYIEKIITDSECLAVRKDSGINSLKDLKGKSIALPFNTSVHFAMLAVLKTAGLQVNDVKLINMRPDSITATWRRKEIDAAYIWHPILGDLVAQDGKVLFATGELKNQGTLVFDGIIVRNDFKQKRPDLVLAYLREYDRMCALYRDKPDEVAAILSPYLSLTPEKTMEYLKTFHSLTPKEIASDTWMGLPGAKDTGVLKTLNSQAQFLKEADQVKTIPPSFAPFVDSSFLAKMV